MKLIFATNNQHKVDEIRPILPSFLSILTMQEAGFLIDIPEPFNTLEENATEKAKVIYEQTHNSCFSEDTGLEVFSLNGEPGVHSARYAGEDRSPVKNTEKLLRKLKGSESREAQFRTIICLIWINEQYLFEGICPGKIAFSPLGHDGFGYDPVFIPYGSEKTFGQMTQKEKSNFSHRRKAVDKLVAFLNKQRLND
ncbi:MAG: RdgB/HAM1 family non-canonical purine NTP pyrophosphatase [Chitinophagaceae bacterium]